MPRRAASIPIEVVSASHGVARILSKLGYCSRAEAVRLVLAGRVVCNGKICRDPEQRTDPERDEVRVDGALVRRAPPVYLMLNKPRDLVTTAADEQGRATVFECLKQAGLPPHVSAVGRLDRASEGLLLFTNDTEWAAAITDPVRGPEKTYHVQVSPAATEDECGRMVAGVIDAGERLAARRVSVLRSGQRSGWLEVVLDEGKNRQIRRACAVVGLEVRRLVRVAVGPLALGSLAKGSFRRLTVAEVNALANGHAARSGAVKPEILLSPPFHAR